MAHSQKRKCNATDVNGRKNMPSRFYLQTGMQYRLRFRMLLVSWTLFLFVFYVRVVSPVDISLGPDSRRMSSSLPTLFSTCHLLPVLPGHHSRYSRGLSRSRRPLSSRVSAYRHSTVFLLLLLLCGDVEPNPGPSQGTSLESILPHVDSTPLAAEDLYDIMSELMSIVASWKGIGRGLRLDSGKLDEIGVKYPCNPKECLSEVLAKWLRKEYNVEKFGEPNWQLIVKTVAGPAAGSDPALALIIAKKHSLTADRQEETQDQTKESDIKSSGLLMVMAQRSEFDIHGLTEPAIGIQGTVASHLGESNASVLTSYKTPAASTLSEDPESSDAVAIHRPCTVFSCGCGECTLKVVQNCTNPVRTKSAFPYMDTAGLTKDEVDSLLGRLLCESRAIRCKFYDLVDKTFASLKERGVGPKDLVVHLISLQALDPVLEDASPMTFQHRSDKLDKCTTVFEVLFVIQDYFSFFNYDVIENIIKKLGSEDDEKMLQQYKEDFIAYCKRRIYEAPLIYGPLAAHDCLVVMKKDGDFNKYSLNELHLFKHRLEKIFKITQYPLRLVSVEEGCIKLNFQIPDFVAKQAFPLSRDQEKALEGEGVEEITYKEYHVLLKDTSITELFKAILFGTTRSTSFSVPSSDSGLGSCGSSTSGIAVEEERHHLAACSKIMRENRTLTLTVMHGLLNGPPRVGKSTLLSKLFTPSPERMPMETPSTGIADRVVQVSVKPSTTVLGTAPKADKIWELQSSDDEAIGLLLAIMTTVAQDKASDSDSHNTLQQSRATTSISQKLTDLVAAFKQRITRQLTINPSITDHDSPDANQDSAGCETQRDAFRGSHKLIQTLLEGSFTFYLTDTGGQPEFQELLAALTAGPSVFFLVFKLPDGLNQRYTVQYVRPGSDREKSKPYVSSFTVKEMLLQSLASIACTSSHTVQGSGKEEPIKPKVVLVGTHKDLVSEEQIQAVQKELKDMLENTDFYRQKVVEFASIDEPAITVDNLHPEGQDMQKVRDIIQRIANDPAFQIAVPYPSLILSLMLRRLTDPVITYQQCQSIAAQCGITSREHLNEALKFLHTKLGVVRYFEDIPELREIVIRDPQIMFDKIANLISSTFTFEYARPSTSENFLHEGFFSLQEIERLTAGSNELLTTSKLVTLLEHLHIIAPIQDDSGRVVEYFMPCVLSHATPGPTDAPVDKTIPHLLVTFECGYCPKGIFSALVAYLLSKGTMNGTAWRLKKDGMARNQVTFHVGVYRNIVAVRTHITHLDVTVQPRYAQDPQSVHEVCSNIRESIQEAVHTVSRTLHYSCDSSFSFAFICYHVACTRSKTHAAIRHEDSPSVSVCCKTGSVEPLQPHHALWFYQETDLICGASLRTFEEQTYAAETSSTDIPHWTQPSFLHSPSSQQQLHPDGEQSSESEYRTLRRNLEVVIDFLSENVQPERLCGKLFSAGMITRSTAQKANMRGITDFERIRPLVYAVLSQVEKNTANYGKFLNILEDEGGMEELVQLLQKQLPSVD